jgi:DNA-binding transcriptional MocR family regulator
MSEVITFDGAPPEGTINLGIGQPSADLLPVELVAAAMDSFGRAAHPLELNYGAREGDVRFLQALAEFLTMGYGTPVDPDSLFVTGGNSQALDMVSTVFARPGDTVFVEEPSYFLAFSIFRDHGLNIVGVPMDDQGIDTTALRRLLQRHRPAFLYTIPSYHNPGGQCLTRERREELLSLSREQGLVLVADEVYQLLHYDRPPPPPLGAGCDRGHVVSLGSFSKILGPGMRLGWIQASAELRRKLQSSGFVNSGGSINHIASHIVRHALRLGLMEPHLARLRQVYGQRLQVMQQALEEHFSDIARWQTPAGGYFFWLRFDPSLDLAAIRDRAREAEAGFQPGSLFSSTGGLHNCMRLCFAHYGESDLREGVQRIRSVIQ